MRFVFMGTGTSAGVPIIGCRCEVCLSPDPRDRRLRTAACAMFIDAHGRERVVLLDAGPDLRQQALTLGLNRCDAILLTHNHVDHIFGLDEVRRFNALMRGPIDVFADEHTMQSVRRVYMHIFEREHNVNDSFVATLIPHVVRPLEPFETFGLRVTPIPLLHGRLEMLGYRLDAGPGVSDPAGVLPLAYCTDVSAIPPRAWGVLAGVRTLVLDALRQRHHPTHLTIDQAIGIAQRVGAESTYFVHMGHDVLHARVADELPDGIMLAHDGLTLG
ncbi:MAG: MBL fold metallo-hydrolase [Phycisphaerales bacterium]|jgi:phosphoribosyl 1,2-cyclic phosphate phosphodiesterase|nr:MBL fold metallo-hydrolase [Phycisphaeraceae bacterium]